MTISVHEGLDVIQHSLALLANVNELSQIRRTNILQLADKSLEKFGQDSLPGRDFLSSPEFTKHLQGKVDSDASLAKVVSTSQQYQPYGNTSCTTTISCAKQFLRGSCQMSGVTTGQSSGLNMAKPLQRLGLRAAIPISLSKFRGSESANITMPRILLITTYRLTLIGGRLTLFMHNWKIPTKETWVLTTVRVYYLPLCQWLTQEVVHIYHIYRYKQEALAEEISNLEVKGPIKKHQAHLNNSLFVVPKSK